MQEIDEAATGLTMTGWLALDIEYEGAARLDFVNPTGFVKGHANAKLDHTGRLIVELVVEEVAAAEVTGHSADIQLDYLLTGQKPIRTEDSIIRGFGGGAEDTPRYGDLAITTAAGILTAPAAMCGDRSWWMGSSTSASVVQLRLRTAYFTAGGATAATYWVLPLTNFISDVRTLHPELLDHPLRVWPLPDLPGADPAGAAYLSATQQRLICFEFAGAPGFIEPLLDYPARKQRLLEGTARTLVTAVMVGTVGTHDSSALADWFPFDFLRLLGFAGGNEVGAQWIEFRDEQGQLVQRRHQDLGHPYFVPGRAIIAEVCVTDPTSEGTGYLLTKAAQCPDFGSGTSRLSVTLRQLLRTGLTDHTLEERLLVLFAVLDGLLEHTKVQLLDLTAVLDPAEKTQVAQVRDTAAAQINMLARAAQAGGHLDSYNTLGRIETKLRAATQAEQKFPLAFAALLATYQLLDAHVADSYFGQHAQPGRDSWAGVLAYYRGIPVHEGYFDPVQKGHDLTEVIQVMNHLRDVLIRITLKMLGYDGTYQPVLKIGPVGVALDWVTSTTSPRDLGYK